MRVRDDASGDTDFLLLDDDIDAEFLALFGRAVTPGWAELLTGEQGRGLIILTEALRKQCLLRAGRWRGDTAQIAQVVGGEEFCFARACGLSLVAFHHALAHPFAPLFVQAEGRGQVTHFTVALRDPPLPVGPRG